MSQIIHWSALRRRLAGMGSGLVQSSAANRSASRVDRVMRDLEGLNRSTEHDFLAVGEQLIKFRSTARDIAEDMASLAGLIAGEEARRASEALAQLLDHGREIDARIERSSQALEQVRELSVSLRRGFSGLGNMVAVFGNLCTLTQIETARLGGAGADLGHLASEIRPLSERIQNSGESVIEASGRLDAAVQGALQTGMALRAAELKQMPALISGVLDSLRAFEQQRHLAAEASTHQAAEYAALSQAIEELVSSIQFHDITRQQVEHVIHALRHFASPDQRRRPRDAPRGNAWAVLGLQSSQLREAARIFADSVGRIEQALASIADRFRDASEGVQTLTGTSAAGGESFFSRMEAQFAAVLTILDTCAAAQDQMYSTTARLSESIGGMSASVAEIRRTEIQIQRISTNATIRAIHIGATGVALNKIAEVMQRLALDSNTHTDEAAAALEGMNRIAVSASRPGVNAAGPADGISTAGAMRAALSGLHSSSESSLARAAHIGEVANQLAREITTLREGISAGRLFAEVAARAVQELDSVVEQHANPASAPDSGVKAHLEHLAKTYTMARQREVHASILGEPALTSPAKTTPKPDATAGELDDNIELF